MTTVDEPGGQVIRPERWDTSLEVDLDPDVEVPKEPVYVEPVGKEPEFLEIDEKAKKRPPIISPNWRTLPAIKASLRYQAGLFGYRTAVHSKEFFRRYLWLGMWYAVIGVGRLTGRQIKWWWFLEQFGFKQEAANTADGTKFQQYRREEKATRLFRFWVLVAELVGVLVVLAILKWLAPGWVSVVVALVAIPIFAHYGRPLDKPIITPALVKTRKRILTWDMVLFAYYAAKLGDPNKEGQKVDFLSTMSRDVNQQGSMVMVALPPGKTFDDALKAKGAIASGLDVSINQVFLTKDKKSERSHHLYVADTDPLAIPAGRTPLLKLKMTDIWKPAPLGLDERGNEVRLLLLWISVLVGAQPRKGKTFSARLLALYAALDPYVKLIVVDGKNSPDWRKFALVAHRIIFGVVPNRQGDPTEMLIETLREVKQHIVDVNTFLSTLPVSECPEGKITRELSRKYEQCRVWMLIMEEFQVYYELDDKEQSEEIAKLLSFIMAVGPSAGVILESSSQKPSGVGATQNVQRLFTRYRDNHTVRLALKCGSRQVSEAVLGTEAYGEGFDAAALPVGNEYRGVGILYGASDATPIVRTYLADAKDAERILHAARDFRQNLGLLTGDAAGEDALRLARDVVADTLDVLTYAGAKRMHLERLAELLAELKPDAYAGESKTSVGALLRAAGVPIPQVKVDNENKNGVKREEVENVLQSREAEGRAA